MLKAQATTPVLQFGWLVEALPATVPVNLQARGLAAHTAVIAQSGAGKSFMLGRFLEELAFKTRARIVILDPNSDFARFPSVNEAAWTKPKTPFASDDTAEAFKSVWEKIGFTVLSDRPWQGTLPAHVRFSAIGLSWIPLSLAEKCKCLGISPRSNPEQVLAIECLDDAQEECERLTNQHYTLERWKEAAQAMWVAEKDLLGAEEIGDWPTALSFDGKFVSVQAGKSLYSRLRELEDMQLWDRPSAAPVGPEVARVCDPITDRRIVCVDVGSLDTPAKRDTVAVAALDELWKQSRRAWEEALHKPENADDRCPIFVVIDEAHNLAPEHPLTESAAALSEALVRIAMEGRKYGLFLVLVTQRPSRVNSNLLSQCDNLCLMKMSNPADVRLVQERFGFVPSGWAEKALEFERGQALLCGSFVQRPVVAQVAPRRTIEGGRSLRDEVWLATPR